MQLVLELLKKIFVALQGVYTKEESDSALAVRDTNIATNTDDLLMQQKINAAMGVATVKYAADQTKYSWTRTTSPYATSAPVDPIVDFNLSAIGEGAVTTDFGVPMIIPNVSNLTNAFRGNTGFKNVTWRFNGSFQGYNTFHSSRVETVDVCAKSIGVVQSFFQSCARLKKVRFVAENGTMGGHLYLFYGANNIEEATLNLSAVKSIDFNSSRIWGVRLRRLVLIGGCPAATTLKLFGFYDLHKNTTLTHILTSETDESNQPIDFPLVADATASFMALSVLDQTMTFPSLHTGDDMFLGSGLSAANISAVLDSLPSNPVDAGGTGIITFTGCPGTSELTQESESVATATAKGWTVEL